MSRIQLYLSISVLAVLVGGAAVDACPFCSAVSQTFSEEMKTMDVVAIAELQKVGEISKLSTSDPQAEVPKSTFVIKRVIKGSEFIKAGDTFDTIYFGEAKKNRSFLAMATADPKLGWTTPLILTDRAKEYLEHLQDLPEGYQRLVFFQDYLEDKDEMLARDAYDEFAKAPYKDVIAMKSEMHHDKLIEFIKNPDVPSNRRRLYFTMLGVCGTEADADLLEGFMQSDDRKKKAGLDAMLACYMILKGEEGLDRVDELFLKNKEAEYADTYAAIMAIRFHGAETDVIPRTRLVKSLRHMLDRPELADLVIPDLARWEDWQVMPKLVSLFISADENSSWVRVPVINYLRACPLPEAAEKIEELRKVDPDSVKRAMQFFPLTTQQPEQEEKQDDKGQTIEKQQAETKPDPQQTSSREPVTEDRDAPASSTLSYAESATTVAQNNYPQETFGQSSAATLDVQARASSVDSLTSIETPATLMQIDAQASKGANLGVLCGVTLLGGGLCFVVMRSILGLK